MNDELERICKEEAVILFRNLPAGTRGWDSKRIPLECKSRDTYRAACSAAALPIMNLTRSHPELYPRLRDVTSATKLQRGFIFMSTYVYVTVYKSLSLPQNSNAVRRYY
jgi:hypothetical protein